MKKLLLTSVLSAVLASNLLGEKIVVGATPVPHAEILEAIKGELKKDGFELEIKEFNDYVIPNMALDSGELDANYFQHIPYLEEFNINKGTNLVKTVGVHIEPIGIYSKKIKSLDELKDGAKVSVPNDPTNESRALNLLEKAGLIKLDANVALKTPLDIVDNPKNLEFIEVEAASVPRTLDDAVIAVINTNFAMNAGFNPLKDSLLLEDKDSPYVNVVAVKTGNEESEKTKALNKAINSQAAKEFIEKTYDGAIIPAF